MFKKLTLAFAWGVSAVGAMSAHSANLHNGDWLAFAAGVPILDASGSQTNVTGSWFSMDTNGVANIQGDEKIALTQGTGYLTSYPSELGMVAAIEIGVTTAPGASHLGCPASGDMNTVDAPWCFSGNTGSDYIKGTPITGGTTSGLNMSGWTMTWAGYTIALGSGAWGAGFSNGVGNFVWDGMYQGNFTLDYHATVPIRDPSGWGGVKYALHLEGCVPGMDLPSCLPSPSPTPEASTYAMMLAGLGLVGFATHRRKARP